MIIPFSDDFSKAFDLNFFEVTGIDIGKCLAGFREEITQWLLKLKAGVYVGKISGAVREHP